MSASQTVGFHVSLEFTCSVMNGFLRTYLPDDYERLAQLNSIIAYKEVADIAGVEFPFTTETQVELSEAGDFADAVENLMFCLIEKCRTVAKENRANA